MRVRVGCEFDYESEAPVPLLMLVRPQPTRQQRIEYESRWTDPELAVREYVDRFGNTCWRFTAPGGALQIRYDALVAIADEPDPSCPTRRWSASTICPTIRWSSRCPAATSSRTCSCTIAWELFGNTPPTWARVQADLRLGPRQHRLRRGQQRPDGHRAGRLRAPRRRVPRLRAAGDRRCAAR